MIHGKYKINNALKLYETELDIYFFNKDGLVEDGLGLMAHTS